MFAEVAEDDASGIPRSAACANAGSPPPCSSFGADPGSVGHVCSICDRRVATGALDPTGITMSWSCPRCGRRFAHEDQFHSHDTVDVDAHFAGRSGRLREAFNKLIGSLPSDVRVEALRSVIVVSAHTTFSYVVVQSRRLLVGVSLDRRLDSSRVVKVDVISPRNIGNVVVVSGPDDVDDELRGWLRQAYERGRVSSAS